MQRAEVVILGAGIVGAATAYYLSLQGLRPLLIERDALGSHASGFAFGELLPWQGRGIPGPLFPLAREAFGLYPSLAAALREETGVDVGFRPTTFLLPAFTEAEASALREEMAWLREAGCPVRWLEGAEARREEPRLSPQVVGALALGEVAMVENYRLVLALVQAAEKRGALLRAGEVRGVESLGPSRFRLHLPSETVECQRVVIALGPWSRRVTEWLGAEVPVEPLKGQLLHLEAEGPPLLPCIAWNSCYATTKADGLLWAGTTEEHAGFDETPTPEARSFILGELLRVLPGLAGARVVRQTACLRPLSADGLPLLGPLPGVEGAYIATGGGRKGILLGPAMGLALADLITQGTTSLPIAPFSPARFAGHPMPRE